MLFSMVLFISACSKDDPATPNTITSVSIQNLAADPATTYDPVTGAPSGYKNLFTFFRFSDSSIVDNSDSASLKWDIGFKSSSIIVNGGVSGPGTAAAFIQHGLFSELKEISADSAFRTDVSFSELAIGSKWSSYERVSMILSPVPGKTLVFRTANNKYVKMEILSYYKDAPASPNAFRDPARYYTFRYVHQGNGTKKFD